MRMLALIGIACGLTGRLSAQIGASADAGLSFVRYDGFLGSTAASFTPAIRWDGAGGRAFVSARATYLRFESGSRSLDGALAGAWLAPLARSWRAELALSGGASDYAGIARFAHGLAETRLHYLRGQGGAWMGITGGRASFGDGARATAVVSIGGWTVRRNITFLLATDRSFVGDTTYSDIRASARAYHRGIALDGSIGARFWSRGGGRGVYGEASASLPLSARLTAVVAAGRYPTDVISGSIAGRYVTAAVRLGTRAVRAAPLVSLPAYRQTSESGVELILAPDEGAGERWLLVRISGASTVEMAADFTQWEPVLLRRTPTGDWQSPLPVPRGIHRINVRIDAGAWIVPAGLTRVADDYGGYVGVFVVP